MRSRRVFPIFVLAILAAAGTGCFEFSRKSTPTGPSDLIKAFTGNWSSASGGGLPSPDSCGNVQWQLTEVSATTVAGTFSATCAGGTEVSGSGTGTLDGATLHWTATGTATQGSVTCPFNISGTAVQETPTTIRVTYSGTVCGVAVSGSDVLKK
jgi:hypothetical protein